MEKLPNHLAIIPDGNRRWARANHLKPWMYHQSATENFKKILKAVLDLEIPYFSFWCLSLDNLKKRHGTEVRLWLDSYRKEFAELVVNKEIHSYQVKVNIIGDWQNQFPEDVKKPMKEAIMATKNYSRFYLNFLIAYSGIDEMIKAIKAIARQDLDNQGSKINFELVKKNLFTKDLPPVDFLIRTGGEPHMSSGFMMWDIADSQMYFSDKFWPEFTEKDLRTALTDYSHRLRHFGK